MLIYHPRNDTYNCVLRVLSILKNLDAQSIEFIRLRAIDFYYVFPHLISDISFPKGNQYSFLKKQAKTLPNPYEKLPDNKRLFSELGDFQIQALHILKAKNVLTEEDGHIFRSVNFENSSIQNLFINNSYVSEEFYKNVVKFLNGIELYGDSGLKKRTGLLEYRYDSI
jgi:hypothetical protein